MPSIDDRIKAELEKDDSLLKDTIGDSQGLNDMVWEAYKSGPRTWLTIMGVGMAVLTVVLIYLLVKFTGATDIADKLTYGLWAILSALLVIGMELWSWMQVNRFSTMREIKQMELAILSKLEKDKE
jgi:hypothetical protein